MTDPNDTLPPRQPNTPGTFLLRAWDWALAHRDYSVPLVAFAVGWLLGRLG